MSDAIKIALFVFGSGLVATLGALIQALVVSRLKPSDYTKAFQDAIQELNATIARQLKANIDLQADYEFEHRRAEELERELAARVIYCNRISRIARRYKPTDVMLPEYKPPNGDTPQT